MKVQVTSLVILFASLSQVHAANDWNVPCRGSCEYDVASNQGSIPATLKVWGANSAISDITAAGGWHILGCDANATVQDIRIVCQSTDETEAGCDHITQNGAVGTLVRLPNGCGKAPFALVKTWGQAKDQSIPNDIARRIVRSAKREDSTVMALQLDSSFNDTDATHGNVSFAIIGTSADDASDDLSVPPVAQRRSRFQNRRVARRGFFSKIKDVFNKVKDTVANAINKVEETAEDLNNVDVNKTLSVPLNFDKSANLASANLDCQPLPPISLSADVKVGAHGAVTLGVVVAGTIIPINVDTFTLSAGLNADLTGDLKLKATSSGSLFDSGDVQLFSAGLPGLDIPDIFSLGPTFTVTGRAKVNMAAEVDLDVGINYQARNVVFAFPPNKDLPSTGDAGPADSPLTLSVSPEIKINGDLTAHITPALTFGVNVLNGKAEADIFINLDTSASLAVNATGSVDLTKTFNTRSIRSRAGRIAARASTADIESRDVSAGIQGCVAVGTGVSANVGAKGQFFSLFNADTSLPLFTKNFQLFSQCFGASTSKRAMFDMEALPSRRHTLGSRDATALTCPTAAAPAAASVTSGTLAASAVLATPM